MAPIESCVILVVVGSLKHDLPPIIGPETRLRDLGADDLDLIELIIALEKKFDVEISDDGAEAVKTVGDLVRLVEGKVGEVVA